MKRSKFAHHQPKGLEVMKAKREALLDITKECKAGLFSRNYIPLEAVVLTQCQFDFIYLPLNI